MRIPWFSFSLGIALLCRTAYTEPPHARVTFQGRLTTTNGSPVPNGSYDMVFKFYDAPSGGMLLLTDRHVAPNDAVSVSAALYSVLLGGGHLVAGVETNLSNVFFYHPEVYLGVAVNAEPEMNPRLPLTRAPYAVSAQNALNLAGAPASQYVQVASNGNMTITGSATITSNIVTSGLYKFSTPRVGRITLGPADFVPRHPFEEQYILWGYPWKTNRHYLVCTMETGSATFHAELHVPEGATLTKLVSYIWDVDNARSSTLNLARCSLYGHLGFDPVYLATNVSANNQVRTETALSEIVNTTAHHYVLTLQLFWSDLGMQFFGAQVEYTYGELKN